MKYTQDDLETFYSDNYNSFLKEFIDEIPNNGGNIEATYNALLWDKQRDLEKMDVWEIYSDVIHDTLWDICVELTALHNLWIEFYEKHR